MEQTEFDREFLPLDEAEPGYIEARIAAHTRQKHRTRRHCADCTLAFERWLRMRGDFDDDLYTDDAPQLGPPIPEVRRVG